MATRSKTRKKRRKVKYRKVVFKISDNQSKQLQKCSSRQRKTTNRIIKTAIREYLVRHADLLVEEPSYVTKNQLKLFDFSEQPTQLEMFADKA